MEEPNIPETKIQFVNPSEVDSGRLLRGNVSITHNLTLQIKEIKVTCLGKGQINWIQNGVQKYFKTETYINKMVVVIDHPSDNGIFLSPGNTEFPFEFELPRDIPSSFKTWSCSVKYYCIASITLVTGNLKLVTYIKKRRFHVNGDYDISHIQDANEPAYFSGEKVMTKFMGCWLAGCISTTMTINKKVYSVGENIGLVVNIVNKTNTFINLFEAQLIRVTTFTDSERRKIADNFPQTICCIQNQVSQRPRSIGIAKTKLRIPIKIPPTDLGSGCMLFNVSYFIKLTVGNTENATLSAPLQIQIPIKITNRRATPVNRHTTGHDVSFSIHDIEPPAYEEVMRNENTTVLPIIDEMPPPPYSA
ncbi:hypothetical protein CHUAL_000614 [Chamberlinius hualienensis]